MTEGAGDPQEPRADEDPLGDLARRVREKRDEQSQSGREREDDTFGALDDAEEGTPDLGDAGDADAGADREGNELFEEMDVSDVDTDAVWESVLDESDDLIGDATPGVDVGQATAADVESTVGDDHIVPKDDYCESCHFFSAPPAAECSYEDAAIVEVVDMEQFRVRNCPVVAGLVDTDGAVFEREEGGDEGDLAEADGGVAEETPSD
ncbi:hypothetical protein C2R22_16210 [Salinigranum rubrum]|uniref:DUF8135 domain-containing protein n=1 Tax=Salinigranum rubrum TaxID=755307 RepID=A0A2I8VM43_9EURY|nr:hypothetical protein [Salinigranum rubrum]AUV82996.1 hypothetical protein C2R22_16210 [Salinigranum rubrum]